MSRFYAYLFCVGALFVLSVGCDPMGSGDDDQPRPAPRTGPPRETSMRGDKALSDAKIVPIEPTKRHEVATGRSDGPGSKSNDLKPLIDSADTSPQTSSRYTGALGRDTIRGFDAIALETADALRLKKTLVVWLVDKTPKSVGIRGDTMQNIAAIGREAIRLAQSRGGASNPLSMAVVAYGKDVTIVTPAPTDDLSQAASLASGIGEETADNPFTFTAVSKAAEQFLPYRNKGYGMIFVIVADTNGRDWDQLDDVLPKLARSAVPVFGIGAAIPFGRQPGEPADKVRCESFALERIDLAYPGGQMEIDLKDSGYGPFGLERLCRISQGRFFRVRQFEKSPGWSTGNDGTIDSTVLKAHAPDYVLAKEYQELLGENKARMALVNAAKVPHADVLGAVYSTVFTKQSNEATLANMLTNAQRGAAEKSLDVDRIYDALVPGESDRPKLTGARWQAEFDLAMGRVLAAKSRIDGYNSILAMIKQGKAFAKPTSHAWVLHRAEGITGSSVLNKNAANARMYLNRVIKEHPGTPWAALAQRELTENVGWELTEE